MKQVPLIFFAVCFCLFVSLTKGQTAGIDNKPSQTITFRPIPKGPSVFGIFEGRPPCAGMVKQLKISTEADCPKLKCNLTLYRDSLTFRPTTYTLLIVGGGDMVKQDGGSYRRKILEGKWIISKGIKSNPSAEVIALELNKTGTYFYLLKGDNNILFVLDETKEFRVGNQDFSYTLNRVELVAGNK